MMKGILAYLNMGLTIIGSILLGLVVGSAIDSMLGSTPVFMIVGVALGMFGAFRLLHLSFKGDDGQ